MAKGERERVGRTILVNILLLILGLSVAYGLFIGLQYAYSTDAPLRVVVSGSMVPEININDVVVVKGVGARHISVLFFIVPVQGMSASDIKLGDNIIFYYTRYSSLDPIVHKVIQINENDPDCNGGREFITQGVAPSNQGQTENPCQSDVIGIVVGKIPYIGSVSRFLQSFIGLAIIATLIIILFAIEILQPQKDEETER